MYEAIDCWFPLADYSLAEIDAHSRGVPHFIEVRSYAHDEH